MLDRLQKNRSVLDLSLILLLSVAIVSPIGFLGIPDNFDVMEHMRFAVTFSDSLAQGKLLPEWSELDNHGFGGAGVRLYPPLTYILLAVANNIGNSWHISVMLVLMLGMCVGCWGVYSFVREFYPDGYPLLASLFYALIPYHLFQIYQLFLFAEFMAAASTPWVFLFGTRLLRAGKVANAIYFTVAFSLVLLTHIPSTIILAISLVIFLGLQIGAGTNRKNVLFLIPSAVVSLILTSFYWLKVVTEVSWIKHDSKAFYDSGLYTYSVYLFPISLDPPSFYQIKVLWLFDIIIALTLILFLFMATVLMRKLKDLDRLGISLIATASLSLFLTTLPSRPIWDAVTLLQKLQFPWRWLSISAFILSILVSVIISQYRTAKEKPNRLIAYSAISLSTIIAIFIISQIVIPSAPMPGERFNKEVGELTSTLGCNCWWPTGAENSALEVKEPVTTGGRTFAISEWENTERRFNVQPGEATNARIATFYYQYWKAEVNGAPVEVGMNDDGTISIPLPAEDATVRLYFSEPAFLDVAKGISLLAWLSMFAAMVVIYRKRKQVVSDLAPIP